MDNIFDYKRFEVLKSTFEDTKTRLSIRLLNVFGCGGHEVIYATDEDYVYCFGSNRFGALGLGTLEENIERPQLNHTLTGEGVTDFFAGFRHWIALTASGQCYAWGQNMCGQLGVGTTDSVLTPVVINELTDKEVIQICCGKNHTLALTIDGQIYSFGSNKFGQLGDYSYANRTLPVRVYTVGKAVSISCGLNHSMALTDERQVFLWGDNRYGQLGKYSDKTKAIKSRSRPEHIPNFKTRQFCRAICGPNHCLLLSSDGHLYVFGQLGRGSDNRHFTPIRICKDIKFKDIFTDKANDLSIAVSENDKFYVWGLVNNEECRTPQEVLDSSVHDIYAKYAKNQMTYKTIIIRDLMDFCHQMESSDGHPSTDEGFNDEEPASESPSSRSIHEFLDVEGFLKNPDIIGEELKKQIRLFHVFGLHGSKVIFATNEDKVFAFGHNRDLTLGLGTKKIHIMGPTLIGQLCDQNVVDFVSGFEHCIALTSDGRCFAWGQNRYGQLGIGSYENKDTPQLIEDLTDVRIDKICCGAYHSMALSKDGDLFSWGHNTLSQLGDRTYNSRESPVQVLIKERVASISCGQNHSLAITETGLVYVWGDNTNGQLGRSPERCRQPGRHHPMSNRPILLNELKNIVFTKAIGGSRHSLLLSIDGDVYAFGKNDFGQIGNGTTDDQHIPVLINNSPNSPKIKDIIGHYDNDLSIAVSDDNKIYYWGFAQNQKFLRPKLISESIEQSIYDIYRRLSRTKITFKTANICEDIKRYVIKSNQLEIKTIVTNDLKNKDLNEEVSEMVDPFEENLVPFIEKIETEDQLIGLKIEHFLDELPDGSNANSSKDLAYFENQSNESYDYEREDLKNESIDLHKTIVANEEMDEIKYSIEENQVLVNEIEDIFSEIDNQMIDDKNEDSEESPDISSEDLDHILQYLDNIPNDSSDYERDDLKSESIESEITFVTTEDNFEINCSAEENQDSSDENVELISEADNQVFEDKEEESEESTDLSNCNSSEDLKYFIDYFRNPLNYSYAEERNDFSDSEISQKSGSLENIAMATDPPKPSNHEISEPKFENEAMDELSDSFNTSIGSDMKFVSEDQVIYCHKSRLESRNGKFWQFLIAISPNFKNELKILSDQFDIFYAFLQNLYGIKPEIDIHFVHDLRNMAQMFGEQELEELCAQHISHLKDFIDLTNVCPLYQKAINDNLTDLVNSCIEFASNNWKNICKSDGFQTMDEKIAKRLISSFVKNFD